MIVRAALFAVRHPWATEAILFAVGYALAFPLWWDTVADEIRRYA